MAERIRSWIISHTQHIILQLVLARSIRALVYVSSSLISPRRCRRSRSTSVLCRHEKDRTSKVTRLTHNYAYVEDRTLIYGWNKGSRLCLSVSACMYICIYARVGASVATDERGRLVSASLKTFLWFSSGCAPSTSTSVERHDRCVRYLYQRIYMRIYITIHIYNEAQAWELMHTWGHKCARAHACTCGRTNLLNLSSSYSQPPSTRGLVVHHLQVWSGPQRGRLITEVFRIN